MSSSEEDDDRPIAYDRLAPLGGLGLPVLGLGLPATAAAPRERCVRPFPRGEPRHSPPRPSVDEDLISHFHASRAVAACIYPKRKT